MAANLTKIETETIGVIRRLVIVAQVYTTLRHLIVHCLLLPCFPNREKDLIEQMGDSTYTNLKSTTANLENRTFQNLSSILNSYFQD